MNGELLRVWSRTWQEVWLPFAKSSKTPEDLFSEFVRNLASPPQPPTSPPAPPSGAFDASGELIDAAAIQARVEYEGAMTRYSHYRDRYETALNSEKAAREFFRTLLTEISSETEAVIFLESAHNALVTYGDDSLNDRFRALIKRFIVGFSLRYEVREPFSLHITIPGVFSKLIAEIRRISSADDHLRNLYDDFEEAFSDLRLNRTQARMKTCLQKQFNLLEALGRNCPNVTATTLGAICDQLDWPHARLKEVGKDLYRFGSDYPGLRHGGTPANALRNLEMKDFISVSLMLASFTPYLTNGLDSDHCYSA
ncbi:hypothetical protein [Mesorhizobium sp. LNHC221B00]|uniref:hypothetical protein n=1 Tax=Mesorhizobium sp. LNHC221B00 TaxID=1287233 RepID=UPI0012EB468E|nr:hypothetical protein [Mesorhizobium sp. LNHC221B00]